MIAKAPAATIKAASYIRMSDDVQKDSPEQQREYVALIAERENCEVVREYCDKGKSGASSKGRPQFLQLLEDVRAKKFQAVIVWDLNRLSREDIFGASDYYNTFRKAGVRLFSQRGEIDLTTSMGRLMTALESEGANDYLVKLSAASTRGKIKRAKTGASNGRQPYGYDRMLYDERGELMRRVRYGERFGRPKTWTVKLAISEDDRADIVRWLFKQYATTSVGVATLATDLNRRHVPAPGGGAWSHSVIQNMLCNPAYVGDYHFGLRSQGKFSEVGADLTVRAASGKDKEQAAIIIPDAHPAIVSRKIFDSVQTRIQDRRHKKQRVRASDYMLSTILRCGYCGKGLIGKRQAKFNYTYRKYVCSGHGTFHNCGHQALEAKLAETKLFELVESLITPEAAKRIEAAIERQAKAARPEKVKSEAAKAQRQLTTLEGNIKRALGNLLKLDDDDDRADAQAIIDGWRVEQRALREQLARAAELPQDSAALIKAARAELRRIRELLTSGDPALVREAISSMVQSATVYWKRDSDGRRIRPIRMIVTYKGSGLSQVRSTTIELLECQSATQEAFDAFQGLYRGTPVKAAAVANVLGIAVESVHKRLSGKCHDGTLKSGRHGYSLCLPK